MIKINILSQGRFHMLDLARELNRDGYDVKFYSYLPKARCRKFGLPSKCAVSLFLIVTPFLLLRRYFPKLHWLPTKVQDIVMGLFMRKCDICISLTGYVTAPLSAKKKGAICIMERGSKHILEQQKILDSNPNKKNQISIPKRNIQSELTAYQFADYISIASQHVKESFLLHNYPEERLFVNPYGVDLSMFRPLPDVQKKYDIIMVGGWGYRKGCDLIIEAVKKTGYSFLHVGGIVDIPFPHHELFTHVDPVDQPQLINYYNQAKIFLLPSREEGLAMVQAQAIACNIPLVGSRDSGAVDLKRMVEYPEYVTIIKDYSVDATVSAIQTALEMYKKQNGLVYAGNTIKNLTWKAYGKRYADFLQKITSK